MAFTPIRPQILCPYPPGWLTTDYLLLYPENVTLDSTSDYWAPHFFCQDAVTIDRFEFILQSVTVAGNITVEIFGLSTAGVPTGAIGTPRTIATGSTGRKAVTDLAASCSADTIYCARVTVDTGTNIAIRTSVDNPSNGGTFNPYGYSANTSGSGFVASPTTKGLACAIGPSSGFSGKFNPMMVGTCTGMNTQGIRSNGTVHAGNRWVPEAPMLVAGIAFLRYTEVGGDIQAILSNAAGSVLASGTMDASQQRRSGGGGYPSMIFFDSPYEAVAGTAYYLMLKGLDTTQNDIQQANYSHNDSLGVLFGTGSYKVTAATLGTYTETNTTMMLVFPVISGVQDGVAGGSTIINSRATSHLRR